ncbi:MAG: hypothetical protein HYX66_00790 [Ignavibacteria bacterium]|nr:hypothetical protein [Ignavibacteria bacterium]
MSKCISFSLEQKEALSRLAAARPRYWADSIRTLVRENPDNAGLMLTYLTDHKKVLEGWRIILPEEHSMALYVSVGPEGHGKSAPLFRNEYEVDGVKKEGPDFIEFEGYDPEKWLVSAVKNLDLLIQWVDVLILELSLDESTLKVHRRIPADVSDSNVKALAVVEDHFVNKKADEIYRVFVERTGQLTMSSGRLNKASFILEAIRNGLGYQPIDLSGIEVFLHGSDVAYTWRRPPSFNNVFHDAVKKAGPKIHNEMQPIVSVLTMNLKSIAKLS